MAENTLIDKDRSVPKLSGTINETKNTGRQFGGR